MGQFDVTFVVYLIIVPVQSIIGIIGNAITYVVVGKLTDRISNLYLRYIAAFNILVLLCNLIYPFGEKLGFIFHLSFVTECPWIYFVRKMLLVIDKTLSRASILVMTCFFMDRYMILTKPNRTAAWRSAKFHRFIPWLALAMAFIWHLPLVRWYIVTRKLCDTEFHCDQNVRIPRSFVFQIYELVREVFLIVLPVLAMCFFAYFITRSIHKFKERFYKMIKFNINKISSKENLPDQRNNEKLSTIRVHMQVREITHHTNGVAPANHVLSLEQQHSNKKTENSNKIILSLYGYVILYCFSIIPSAIISIIYSLSYLDRDIWFDGNLLSSRFSYLVAVSTVLNQANYCWCFYLYALLDSQFRSQVYTYFRSLH